VPLGARSQAQERPRDLPRVPSRSQGPRAGSADVCRLPSLLI
jgi:hypothetical protein